MPTWLKKIKENEAEKSKNLSFERLKNRIELSFKNYTKAEIMDIWEEVEKLKIKDLENLKKSLTPEARDFLENIILK